MKRYFPWIMALVACLALWISNGLSISGLSVFDEALINEFGWDRGALKLNGFITLAVAGLVAPFAGILIDRYGVRICMIIGWSLLAGAFYFYSMITSLAGLYAIHVVLGIVLTLCGLNAAVILVSQWFVKHRGLAIGIALVGTSLGGAIMPQYGTYLLTKMEWRQAFQAEIVFPVLMLLVTIFIVRNNTGGSDAGVSAAGSSNVDTNSASENISSNSSNSSKNTTTNISDTPVRAGEAGNNTAGVATGMSYGEALRTRTFWAITAVAMTTFYTVLGAQAHLFLHMRDLGFTAALATHALSVFFGCALVGKFIFGLLADHLDGRRVLLGNFIVMIGGAVCLATLQASLIWVAVAAFGFGWGGVYTLIQLNVVNAFGLKAAGKILGTITVLDALGGGLGIWLTGVMYEVYGSYDLAFKLFVVLIALAMVAMTQMKIQAPKQATLAPAA
ncbi:MFS transporter [Exilibacterium tricleocarpae]|uniref:MFS transporter n=1 Tax=Exilibacterium tricleocarpae TaxID=2591008 RepID=A0A545T5V5_9GAMM|nr:MFS transporter [Exilibacterium tricleocarpae]TQV72620.1 MFS transporter [Exilibacterium tricleocarpae]